MIVSEALKMWQAKKARAWCPKTAEYVGRLAEGWRSVFGGKEVADVGVLDVERLETERDNGKRSASALNQERTYLRQFFRWAEACGMRQGSCPASQWTYRRPVVKREYVALTREQEDRLVEEAELPWLRAFIRLGVCTGLREGTLRKLDWSMVKDGVLEIPAKLMKQRRALRLPLAPRALEAIGPPGAGLLLPGLPRAETVYREFKRAVWRSGAPRETSPHDLRRTFVARLAAAGVPTHIIMQLGGWRTLGVLVSHYCAAVPVAEARSFLEAV